VNILLSSQREEARINILSSVPYESGSHFKIFANMLLNIVWLILEFQKFPHYFEQMEINKYVVSQ
jgi:hypothetical protein